MPSEEVGACGESRWPDREAIAFELGFGIACLRRHCGPEPPGCSLEVVWHEHDSGAYATISLIWEQGSLFEEHSEYINRCGNTLDELDQCVDWEALHAIAGPRRHMSAENVAALVELVGHRVDLRALYCRCCPHRPVPSSADLHWPFADCDCCPRSIPKDAWNLVAVRPTKCQACKGRVREERTVGVFFGLVGGNWLVAIASGGLQVAIIGSAVALVGGAFWAWAWWSERRRPWT